VADQSSDESLAHAGQIIAMGGGGFSMEPENRLLDQYVLEQSGKSNPAICFIPPSGEADDYIVRFYSAFTKLNCRPSHLSLFQPPTADLESFILEKDVVYVGGGNTRSMLAVWREWELDRILRLAWTEGVLLCGLSAGSICWFEQGVTDSIPGTLTALRCLGFLPGSNCPHYDGEVERRPSYQRLIREGLLQGGYAADYGVALHFIGVQLSRVVSSRPTAMAYQVRLESGNVVEEVQKPEYLGKCLT
jgi:dipeptidase E